MIEDFKSVRTWTRMMQHLSFLTLVLCGCVFGSHGLLGFSEMGIYSRMKGDLKKLCPEVDICNSNTSAPTVMPNGFIDSFGEVSCCKACSCHENCQDNMNCCFPDDADRASGINRKTGMECVYIQTGEPDVTWPSDVPAYRMVTSAPEDGCKLQTSFEKINASCEIESVTPWGNLFPVYSREKDKIYINQHCAHCHGVLDGESWHPFLVCNKYKESEPVPISEHMQYLESGSQTSSCFVTFRISDGSVLHDKRCYKNRISTCSGVTFQVPTGTNLTAEEVVDACTSGLSSPVPLSTVVFENIFCSICNDTITRYPKTCRNNDLKDFGSLKISFLLNAAIFQVDSPKESKYEMVLQPQVCKWNDNLLATEVCKTALCPSGQIRGRNAGCIIPLTRWYEDSFLVFLRLNFDANFSSALSMFFNGAVHMDNILDAVAAGTPWPKHWTISMIYRSIESQGFYDTKSIAIALMCDIKNPKVLIDDIKRSIDKPWRIIHNRSSSYFQQSFLEYMFEVDKENIMKPSWLIDANSSDLRTSINMSIPQSWKILYRKRFRFRPYVLTKLHTCEQISLFDEEYDLIANNAVLISNLTTRVLFDAEFDLVYDTDGKLRPMVCVSDTSLKQKQQANAACPTWRTNNVGFAACLLWILLVTDLSLQYLPQ